LNTAPLIWSFIYGSRQHEVQLLTDAAPARCAQLLARAQTEAALVPVIEYQQIPETVVVPHVCVGSRSRVLSVVVVTRGPELKDARTVALDTSSRTSAALVRIIFREFLHREPDWKPCAPDLDAMLNETDAALIIGDPAITFPREGLRVYDLAGLWREHTGMGFVFAMWMARADSEEKAKRIHFAAARDEGLEHVEEIAALYQRTLRLSLNEIRSYLTESISFTLTEEMRAGLELYYNLAHRHGVIQNIKPLKMIETKS
jgi:chorismate dehydratase